MGEATDTAATKVKEVTIELKEAAAALSTEAIVGMCFGAFFVASFVMFFWCLHRINKKVAEADSTSSDGTRRRLVFSAPFTSLLKEVNPELLDADPKLWKGNTSPEPTPSPILNEIEPDLWMVAASLTLWSAIGYLGYVLYTCKRCLQKRDQTPELSRQCAIN